MESCKAIRKQRSTDQIVMLQKACKQAEVSLYMFFPAYEMTTWELGCTPWRLREDREAFQLVKVKDWLRTGINVPSLYSECVEVEFEVDGDAVMQE